MIMDAVDVPARPGRVSVLFGQQVNQLEPVVEYARVCEARGMRLWLGQSLMIETHAALAAVAGRGISIETGLSVAVAPLRSPVDAFTQARSVAKLMGRPIAAGYGMGSAKVAGQLLGREFTAPAQYMASYVEQIKALKQDPSNFNPDDDGPATGEHAIEVGCGVLRPRMTREAGRVADFVVSWLTPRDYLASTLLDALDTGAAAAGRARPRVVSIVQCALAGADRNPVRLASMGCGQHIRLPHYANMLQKAGIDITGSPASDLRAALRTGLFAYGSAHEIAAIVNSYFRVGVDEVVLNVGSVGLEHGNAAALNDVEEILEAVGQIRTEQLTSTER